MRTAHNIASPFYNDKTFPGSIKEHVNVFLEIFMEAAVDLNSSSE